MQAKQGLSWTGIGIVDKWDPNDLLKKTNIETALMKDHFKREKRHGLCIAQGSHVDCDLPDFGKLALIELRKQGIKPISTLVSHNAVVNNGLTDIGTGLTTAGLATPYNNANAKIGVGDTATATTLADVDLKAAANVANRYTMAMDATFPTVALGVYTFRATWATGNGNFAWQEWVVSNAAGTGATALTRILNRAVASLGTKTSAQSWQFTATITLA